MGKKRLYKQIMIYHKQKADHIAAIWQVSIRMAKYDVEVLVKTGLIRFVGARKTGWYEAT